ncbi:hypothetical protein JN11_01994 [Mucilaginibacter frigoritolerans]|jgi:hypothetical protein|uniref:Uncharacterized protein n=1 Tax=Mucilaginibacter frigoritolerans TaxID=652788 RepID=A0A562U4N9_9SPHI|nr:hypothetical protein [Mucilaginibacter frigoritolerans]TWJ00738.1 hypothetical protein JN11_01994 [Mucilaginibacter frigoritolerans]
MKLRIKGNSLRYRLTKSDVSQLAEKSYVEEKVDFGEQVLIYALKITNDAVLISTFKNNTITLCMPVNMLTELQNTDKVGFEGEHGNLHLLIEKDFTCLDNVIEDQSDNYPNPLAEKFYEK